MAVRLNHANPNRRRSGFLPRRWTFPSPSHGTSSARNHWMDEERENCWKKKNRICLDLPVSGSGSSNAYHDARHVTCKLTVPRPRGTNLPKMGRVQFPEGRSKMWNIGTRNEHGVYTRHIVFRSTHYMWLCSPGIHVCVQWTPRVLTDHID